MEKQINKTELLNFLNGNCEEEESIVINQFLKTAIGQNLLNELLNEHWYLADDEDIDKTKLSAWKKEWSVRFNEERNKTKKYNLTGFFRYAAIFTALILGVGIYSVSTRKNKQSQENQLVQKNPSGRHSNFLLPDGTRIFLGPESSLSYPSQFSGDRREVNLEGEAYFEVTKNEEKPFIIYTENIRTQVLGTTFKVNAFKNSPILVAVTSGKVRVDRIKGDKTEELAVLLPGEQVAYTPQAEVQRSSFNIESVKNWKQGLLVFNGTPLSELSQQISRWYNVSITIKSEPLKQIPITVTLDGNMPVQKFLDGLSVSFGFNYTLKNQTITIY